MAHAVDAVLGSGESTSDQFIITGYCDILIENLTSGSVKFQYKLPVVPGSTASSMAWTDFPDASWSSGEGSSFYKTIFISEHGVRGRLIGVSNNTDVYVRLARYNNK